MAWHDGRPCAEGAAGSPCAEGRAISFACLVRTVVATPRLPAAVCMSSPGAALVVGRAKATLAAMAASVAGAGWMALC